MSHFKRNLITTALPYANGPVHIGHLAGVYVPYRFFRPIKKPIDYTRHYVTSVLFTTRG